MRTASRWALLLLVPALTLSATPIPADLQAHADALAKTAKPAVLAWVHDEAGKLAKATGPVDVRSLETAARSKFGVAQPSSASTSTHWAILGSMEGADIEALCFLVLMQSAKSAQEDIASVMASTKAINNAKAQQRELLSDRQKLSSGSEPTKTPTPGHDRVALLVDAARGLNGKIGRTDLSHIVAR